MQKDFIANVERILHENGVDPSFLEIEITETSLIENEVLAIEVIKQLRNAGIKVSLDDFGTGYSALSYLKHFEVDSIKIDRSFIQEIGVDKQDELVLIGIIQLIRSLNLNVIAEGVETEDQLHFLQKNKCNQVQGYVYSRPVKAEEFATMLSKGKIDLHVQMNQMKHDFTNQRRYYRINLTYPLIANMTIIKFMGRDITLGKTEVLIEDIGLGGLSFASNIKMAVRPDMVLSVETVILGQSMDFVGRIVWCRDWEDDFNYYGLEFMIDETERDSIAKVLNSFSLKLRNKHILPDSQFIMTDAKSFFKKNK